MIGIGKKKRFTPDKITATKSTWIDFTDKPEGALTSFATKWSPLNFSTARGSVNITVGADGIKRAGFNGTQAFVTADTTARDFFARFHQGSISYSMVFIGKIGNSSDPNAAYGIIGNNSGGSANTGFGFIYDDRVSVPRNNALLYQISRSIATTGLPVNIAQQNVLLPNNRIMVIIDVVQSATLKTAKAFVDGVQVLESDKTATAYNPGAVTQHLEIGTCGNNVLPLTGEIEHIFFTQSLLSSREKQLLMGWAGISPKTPVKYLFPATFHKIIDGGYTLVVAYSKNPLTGNYMFVRTPGTSHYPVDGQTLMYRISTDGVNFGSESPVVATPAGAGLYSSQGGYTSGGRFCLFYVEVRSGQNDVLKYTYSDNDGATWSTPATISYLTGTITNIRPMDTVKELANGDLLMACYSSKSGNTENEICNLRSTDGGLTFVRDTNPVHNGAVYKNESSIAELTPGTLIQMARLEATQAYEQWKSTDNGLTWTSQGTTTLNDTFTVSKHPPSLRTFMLNGVKVVACYYVDRARLSFKVKYAKASDLVNGVTAWNSGTVFVWELQMQTVLSGYPQIIHENGIGGFGFNTNETTYTTVAEGYFFRLPTAHTATVITELGL